MPPYHFYTFSSGGDWIGGIKGVDGASSLRDGSWHNDTSKSSGSKSSWKPATKGLPVSCSLKNKYNCYKFYVNKIDANNIYTKNCMY